jgi:hypothetical protein
MPMTWTKVSLLFGTSVFLSAIPALAQVSTSGRVVITAGSGPQPTINAPYSVVEETEQTQTLGDGTHIVRKTQARLYRDSYGRTRRESFDNLSGMPSKEPTHITIHDPVAGTTYWLSVQERVAQLLVPMRKHPTNPNVVQQPVLPPEEMRPRTTSQDLGTQSIEGVLAEGVRMTTLLPEGSEGNDRPIQIVRETWVSNELGLTLLEKQFDPRHGEAVMRVTSLDRSEPDPALFQVPPDYILRDPNAK